MKRILSFSPVSSTIQYFHYQLEWWNRKCAFSVWRKHEVGRDF